MFGCIFLLGTHLLKVQYIYRKNMACAILLAGEASETLSGDVQLRIVVYTYV